MVAVRITFVVILAICFPASMWGDVEPVAQVYSSSPDGAWRYHISLGQPEPPGTSTTYFATSVTEYEKFFSSYALAHAEISATGGGDSWKGGFLGDDEASFQIFSTYIQSDIDQTINLAVVGDDGHSLFVNDAFVVGGGFGAYVTHSLVLEAGVPKKLELAGYNGPDSWNFGI